MNHRFSRLPQPSRDWALFLDFDGTLVDLAPTPDSVSIPDGLPGILERLRDVLDGAVAIVSGRPLSDIDRFFGSLRLAAAGQHGAEVRSADGAVQEFAPRGEIAALLPEIRRFAATRPGLLVESKGMSIAVHYRLAPEQRLAVMNFMAGLTAGHQTGLETIAGHGVVELRWRGFDKGMAVRRFLADPPFRGRVPICVGDDTTDEDGFRAALDLGGAAVKVGLCGDSLAEARLADPAMARQWLSYVAESCGGLAILSRHACS